MQIRALSQQVEQVVAVDAQRHTTFRDRESPRSGGTVDGTGQRVVGATMRTPEEAVRTLLASEDSWMRSCGLFAIGTLELRHLEPELDRALVGTDPLERQAALRAKTHLAPADEPVLQTVDADRWMGGTAGVG